MDLVVVKCLVGLLTFWESFALKLVDFFML